MKATLTVAFLLVAMVVGLAAQSLLVGLAVALLLALAVAGAAHARHRQPPRAL